MIPAPDWLSAFSLLPWPLPSLMSWGSFFVCMCLKTPGYWSSHQKDALGNGDSLCCWHSVHSLEGAVQSNHLPEQMQLPRLAKMSTLKPQVCSLTWKTRLFQVSSISDCSVFPRGCTVCAEGYVWDSWGCCEPFLSRAFTCLKFSHIVCLCLLVGFLYYSRDRHLAVGLVPAWGTTWLQSSLRAGWGPGRVGCQMPPHSRCHHTWATFGALVLAVVQAERHGIERINVTFYS